MGATIVTVAAAMGGGITSTDLLRDGRLASPRYGWADFVRVQGAQKAGVIWVMSRCPRTLRTTDRARRPRLIRTDAAGRYASRVGPAARTGAGGPSRSFSPLPQLNLNGSLRTTAEDHQAIKLLVTNANAREQAANLVARIPAIPSQRAAKAEWVSGIREGVRLDVETADAVFTILSGDPTAGRRELDSKALANIQFQSNKLVAQADGALGVK